MPCAWWHDAENMDEYHAIHSKTLEDKHHISWFQKCSIHFGNLFIFPYNWGMHHTAMQFELRFTTIM
jgi:hypothetical protein